MERQQLVWPELLLCHQPGDTAASDLSDWAHGHHIFREAGGTISSTCHTTSPINRRRGEAQPHGVGSVCLSAGTSWCSEKIVLVPKSEPVFPFV